MWIKIIVLCLFVAACSCAESKKKEEARGKRNLEYSISHTYPHSNPIAHPSNNYRSERRISNVGPPRYPQYFPSRPYTYFRKGKPQSPPPYAVQMEPLVHYSQRDPLYDPSTLHLLPQPHNELTKPDDLLGDNNHLSEHTYGPPKHYIERPVYIKEPEPIIEIIIKEANTTVAPPEPAPLPLKKKKEEVQVFYVKYKKNPNGNGKDSVIYDKPIPAISKIQSESAGDHEDLYRAPEPPVTYAPPTTTTIRAIIKPDSETYHANSGIHITFGGPKHNPNAEKYSHDDEIVESAPEPAVAHPQGRRFPEFGSGSKGTFQTIGQEYRPEHRAPQPYKPFNFNQASVASSSNFNQAGPSSSSSSHFNQASSSSSSSRLNQQHSYSRPTPPPQFPQQFAQNFQSHSNSNTNFNQQNGFPSKPAAPQFQQNFQGHQPRPYQPEQRPAQNPPFQFPRTQTHFPINQQPPLNQPAPTFNSQFSQRQQSHSSRPSPPAQQQTTVNHHHQSGQQQHSSINHQQHASFNIHQQSRPQQQQSIHQTSQQQQQQHIAPQRIVHHQISHSSPQISQQQYQQHQSQSQQPQPTHNHIHQSQQSHNQIQQTQHVQTQIQQSQQIQIPPQRQNFQIPAPQHQQTQNFQSSHSQQNFPNPQPQPQKTQNFQSTHNQQYQQFGQQNVNNNNNQDFRQQQFNLNNLNNIPHAEHIIPPGGELIQSLPKFEQHISIPPNPSASQDHLSQQEFTQKIQQQFRSITNDPQEHNYNPQQNVATSYAKITGHGSQPSHPVTNPPFIYQTTQRPATTKRTYYSSTTPVPTTTTTPVPPTTSKTESTTIDLKSLNIQLPDEVPDDLREQLLSSGILKNAQISVLDYDKVGDIPISALPPDQLANFYNAGGAQQISASEPKPSVVKPDGTPVMEEDDDQDMAGSEIDEVKVKQPPTSETAGEKGKEPVEMKVVHYDPQTQQGQNVHDSYVKEGATQVDPVVLNDQTYNRYLPLKVSGAQFPIPDVPELKGKDISSVVVLAPVDYNFNGQRVTRKASQVDDELKYVRNDALKDLLKDPSGNNYKRFLERENNTTSDKQAVILLVTGSDKEREIFMYDVATKTVSKLDGELSAAFVDAAETNASPKDAVSAAASNRVETKVLPPEGLDIVGSNPLDDMELDGAASELFESKVPIIDPHTDLDADGSEQFESFVDISGFPVNPHEDLSSAASEDNHVYISPGYSKTEYQMPSH